jgi:hypothetical protein
MYLTDESNKGFLKTQNSAELTKISTKFGRLFVGNWSLQLPYLSIVYTCIFITSTPRSAGNTCNNARILLYNHHSVPFAPTNQKKKNSTHHIIPKKHRIIAQNRLLQGHLIPHRRRPNFRPDWPVNHPMRPILPCF